MKDSRASLCYSAPGEDHRIAEIAANWIYFSRPEQIIDLSHDEAFDRAGSPLLPFGAKSGGHSGDVPAQLEEWKNSIGADFVATSLNQAAMICCRETQSSQVDIAA
jgi:hypothetical protein